MHAACVAPALETSPDTPSVNRLEVKVVEDPARDPGQSVRRGGDVPSVYELVTVDRAAAARHAVVVEVPHVGRRAGARVDRREIQY